MKIVCVTTLFFDYVIQLSNSLSERAGVTLMLPDSVPEVYLEHLNKRVSLYLFKYPGHSYYPAILATVLEIKKQIDRLAPDVIHLQVTGILPGLLLPLVRRYPTVATFHDIKPHLGSKNQWFFRLMLYCARKFSAQFIVHGQNIRAEMMEMYGVPEARVNAVPLGGYEVANFKKHERVDLKEEGNLILFFGTIWEYKGLAYLIKAEPLITKELPEVRIVIAGTGEDFSKYEEIMINRENFIVHNHHVSYREGAGLFQRASLVVLPYINASQSGVISSAYGFGKPVVATRVGSIPEIVDDGVTGFIVPPGDSPALADAVVKLMKNEKLRKRMGENAQKKLKEDLSWDAIADKTILVYQKAIRAPS